MKTLLMTIRPETNFATSLKGDSLFGQFCWAIVNRFGVEQLENCLKGYLTNNPFLVVSDGFLKGYIPKPNTPLFLFGIDVDVEKRKQTKRKKWLKKDALSKPFSEWHNFLDDTNDKIESMQTHNSINPETGKTGEGGFAPYTVMQYSYPKGTELDIYLCYDETKISLSEIELLFSDMGNVGFGKDASTGLGKYSVVSITPFSFEKPSNANAILTLSPCVEKNDFIIKEKSYYKPFIRFGKHGGIKASEDGNPFKNPILMMDTSAVLSVESNFDFPLFIGQGLTNVSKHKETVHQAYSIAVPIFVDKE